MAFLKRFFTSKPCSPDLSLCGSVIKLTDSSIGFSSEEDLCTTGKIKLNPYDYYRGLLSDKSGGKKEKIKFLSSDESGGKKEKYELNLSDSSQFLSSDEIEYEKDKLNLPDPSQAIKDPKKVKESKTVKETEKDEVSETEELNEVEQPKTEESNEVEEPKKYEESETDEESETVNETNEVEEPKTAKEPTKYEESETDEESETVKEPNKVEEPKTAKKPKKVKEPKTVKDPKKVKEPKIAKKQKKVKEPKTVEDPKANCVRIFKKPKKVKESKKITNRKQVKDPIYSQVKCKNSIVKEPKKVKNRKQVKDPLYSQVKCKNSKVTEPKKVKSRKKVKDPIYSQVKCKKTKVKEPKTGKNRKQVKDQLYSQVKCKKSKVKEPMKVTNRKQVKDNKTKSNAKEKKNKKKFEEAENIIVVDEYKMEPGTEEFADAALEVLCCMLQILLRIGFQIAKAIENAIQVFAIACFNCASLCQQLVRLMPACCMACYYKNRCLRQCNILNTIQALIISLGFIVLLYYVLYLTYLDYLMNQLGYTRYSPDAIFKKPSTLGRRRGDRSGGADYNDQWDLPKEIPTPADFSDWDTNVQQEEDTTTESETKHEKTSSEVVSTRAEYEDVVVEYDTQSNLVDIPVYESTLYDNISTKKVVNTQHKTIIDSLTMERNIYNQNDNLVLDGKESHDSRTKKIKIWTSLGNEFTNDKNTSSENHNLLNRLQAALKNKSRNKEQSLTKSVPHRTAFVSRTGLFSTGDSILLTTMSGQPKKNTFFEPIFKKNVLTEKFRHLGGVSIPAEEWYFGTRWNTPSKTHTERTVSAMVTNPVLVAPNLHGFGDFR